MASENSVSLKVQTESVSTGVKDFTSSTGQGHPTSASEIGTPSRPTGRSLSYEAPTGFSDAEIRRGFVRKVYGLLFTQLLFTFGTVILFTAIKSIKMFVRNNPAFFYAAYGVFFVVFIAMACVEKLRRRHPYNLISLCVFTVAFTYMLAVISSFFTTYSVVVGAAMTTSLTLAIALFSLQTCINITTLSLVIFMAVVYIAYIATASVVLIFGLFGFYGGPWDIVLGSLICLLFIIIIAFDFHMVVGDKDGFELDPEEYVFAVLQIYIHVIYLFLIILALAGGGGDD